MKRIFKIAIVAVFALMTLSFTAGDGVTLRLHPQKDKVYTITSKTTQTTTMKVQGQSIRSNQTVDARQIFRAKEVSSDKNVFVTKIEAVKMTVSSMGMNLTYDSEHPENNSPMLTDQAYEIDRIINKPVYVTFDKLGYNTNPDDVEMSQLSNVIIVLPEEEVHVGSQWTYVKSQNVSNYDVNVNMTYTVTGISKKSVDVSFTGAINTKDISGTYNGTASINPQTGIVMSGTIRNDISATIAEQGFVIPTTISGTTTINVKEQ